MRVSLNALSLRPDGAGVSTYVRELLHALPAEWQRACTALVQADAAAELPSAVTARTVTPRAGTGRALSGALMASGRGELMHGLDVDLPLRRRGPTVTTVHDLSVFDVPWAFDGVRVRGERALVRHALRRADVVLSVSDFTAARVRALFGRESTVTRLAPARDMVPAGPEAVQQVQRKYALPPSFVLHVGTVEPRKDVPRLADACRAAGLPLVLAGGGPSDFLPGHVRRLGFVPRSDLPALFGASTVTAYASLYEGFGLPPVEALACGANVVSTPIADLPDLLGDRVTWIAEHGTDGLAAALRRAVADPPDWRPLTLDWQDTARETVRVYADLGVGLA